MSDSMETGGFGKNPVIDKINRINTAKSRISAVSELEKKIFCPVQPKQKAVLDRRNQIAEKFQISFKKGGKQQHGTILHGGERGMLAGEYPVRTAETGQARTAVRTAGRVLPNAGRQTAQVLPKERTAGTRFGEQLRRADNNTVTKAADKIGTDTIRSRGIMSADRGTVPQIQAVSGLSLRRRKASDRLVSDGDDGYGERTYQSGEYSEGENDTADLHISD